MTWLGHGAPAIGSIAALWRGALLGAGVPGTPENIIGALGVGEKAGTWIVIGARVPGNKAGLFRNKDGGRDPDWSLMH